MTDLAAHLEGTRTYGHYMLDSDSKVKLFAFDIDLEKNTPPAHKGEKFVGSWVTEDEEIVLFDAREAWLNRRHPARTFLKTQLMLTAQALASIVVDDLQLPCAVAYSGGKGVHVYAFTGLISAKDAREGADIVLETLGDFEPTRGDNFFRAKDQRLENGMRNLTIEVFPKQDSLDGKDLGNLMRMPLGRNLKNPKDPTFFIDVTKPSDQMVPIDAALALTATSPWRISDVV